MFDKDKFAKLLEDAKGERSISEYGRTADVDPGYLSRFLRCLKDSPPSAKVLKRLADTAFNMITLDQLMEAAGYTESQDKPNQTRDLPQTVAPYLPDGFDELSPEAKEEVLNYIDYIMVKYGKKDKGKK